MKMTAIKPQGRAGMLALLLAPLLCGQGTPLKIPDRAPSSLFHGQQGKQRTEIHFDPATGTVTVKLLVQDPNGYFIPGIRRENFAVYVDGVRQNDAAVEIEHAPVTLAVLFEYGGRYPGLNKSLTPHRSCLRQASRNRRCGRPFCSRQRDRSGELHTGVMVHR
jgi:hypothetical protein